MKENRRVTTLLSLLAMFTLIGVSTGVVNVNIYATSINEGTIVYEQPTSLSQLSKVPLQILIGLGVVVAAIAIFVLYKVRK